MSPPAPPNAQPAVRWADTEDGVVHLVLDSSRTHGAVDAALIDDFVAAAGRVAGQAASIRGVLIRSGTPSWFGRTDVAPVGGSDAPTRASIAERSRRLSGALRRIEESVPCAAVIEGSALGTGLEIALGCHRRFVLADRGIRLGMPDIRVGVLPACGGVVRTTRMLGFVRAYERVLRYGKTYDPAAALSEGLVDEIGDTSADLIARATRWLLANPTHRQPWDTRGWAMPGGTAADARNYFTLHAMPALLRKERPDVTHYPALLALLAATVECTFAGTILAASEIESRYARQVMDDPVTQRLVKVLYIDTVEVGALEQSAAGLPAHLDSRRALPAVRDIEQRMGAALQAQAIRLCREGVPPASIDKAHMQAGFRDDLPGFRDSAPATPSSPRSPGPLALADIEVRLLCAAAEACLVAPADSGFGEADLASIAAGFPAWTGGAAAYRSNLATA